MKEGPIHFDVALISNNQAPKITEPCKGSLNFPSFPVSFKFPAILGFRLFTITSMWSYQIYFQIVKAFSKGIAVIAFIGNNSYRTLLGSTLCWARYLDSVKGLFGQLYFRGRCRGKGASQRNTLAVDHHHPLCTFALLGFPDASAPFFAGAKLPSIKASCQSSTPLASSIDRNLRQTSNQTPWSSQSRNRRQHVDALGYRSGKSCQRAPVRKTHKIPSRTCRLSIGGRPPFRFGFGSGSSGFSSFHLSSFMDHLLISW